MEFNDLLFNEMKEVPDIATPEYEDIFVQLAEKEGSYDIISVWFIPNNSLLMNALATEWYNGYEDAFQHIRSAVKGTYHDEEGMFFVTGAGYDIISDDLLDRQPDGKAKKEFLDKLNED